MRSTRRAVLGASLLGVALALAACGSSGSSTAADNPGPDQLAQIEARGVLVLATDPAYPPQSYLVATAKRPTTTKCTESQWTGNQIAGYDADVSKLVAQKLGVESCFVAPTWAEMTSGHWQSQWDIAFASIGITRDRMKGLYYTQPYSAEGERFYVRTTSPYTRVEQLSGKRLGGCTNCAAQYYIQRTLDLPGQAVTFHVHDATFVGYDVESNGLAAVAHGKLTAFLCGVAVGQKAIKQGLALRQLGGNQYLPYIAGAVDRSSGLNPGPFMTKVDTIVRQLQLDGTLRARSLHYFGIDFATPAVGFDLASLGQDKP